MASELVLVTGVNGFIGYATVVKALRSGYRVRAAVRRQDAVDFVKARGVSIHSYMDSGLLEWAIIPDIGDRTAFASAARGCHYIVHIAFPLGNRPGNLHQVAVSTIDAMLYAAEENGTIKRIIWTSSVGGLYQFERFLPSHLHNKLMMAGKSEDVPPWNVHEDAPLPEQVSETSPAFMWYCYAKTAAQKALRRYASDSRSPFDIVIIYPSWVTGPHELAQTQEEAFDGKGTNSILLFLYQPWSYNSILGLPSEDEPFNIGGTVHIDDVAEAHVKALTVNIPDDQNLRGFLMCSDTPYGSKLDDAIAIVQKHFPEEAAKMRPDAHFGTIPVKFDCNDTELELLGHPMKTYKTIAFDTMQWYSRLPRTTPYQT